MVGVVAVAVFVLMSWPTIAAAGDVVRGGAERAGERVDGGGDLSITVFVQDLSKWRGSRGLRFLDGVVRESGVLGSAIDVGGGGGAR